MGKLGWPNAGQTLPIALLLNLLTFFMYRIDKHGAQNGQWRTPENTLHLLGLLAWRLVGPATFAP